MTVVPSVSPDFASPTLRLLLRMLLVFGALPLVQPTWGAGTVTALQAVPLQSFSSGDKETSPASPVPSQSFAGISPANSTPPDSHGAVGPNHIMTQINGMSIVQDRSGNRLSSTTLTGFWSSVGVSDVFDPRVVYDPHSDRFIVVACAQRRSSASGMLFGISATGDPTGTWYLWLMDGDSTNKDWVDYPNIGLLSDRITFTSNMFTISGDGFSGINIWTIDKSSAMDGGGLTFQLQRVTNSGGTLVPAMTYDAGETTQYLVRTGTSNIFGTGRLQVYSLTGNIGSLTLKAIPYASIGSAWSLSLPNAKQLGSSATIETNDDRLMNAVVRNGRMWTTHTVAFDTVSRDHAAVKWWEIRPSDGTVIQTGLIEDVRSDGSFDLSSGTYYYFPSIAVSATNDVLIGFSGSSAKEYVSAYYAYRPSTAPAGMFNQPLRYRSGLGTYSGPRWGDYSATVVDPVDEETFWTIQQYAIGGNKTANYWAKVGEAAADTTRPQVSGATALSGTTVRVTFDETMENNAALVNPAFYTFSGGLTASNVTRLSTTQVSVTTGEMRNGTSYTVTVGTGGPTDIAGNTVSSSANTATFTGLGTSPTATIGLANSSPTNLDSVAFDVAFSESVGSSFTAADVSVSGSLAPGAGVVVTGGPVDFTVRVTPSDPNGEGTIGITIGSGITDSVGNTFAGGSSPGSYTIENTAPAISVNVLVTTDRTPPLSGTINDSTASISVVVNGQTRTATNNGNGTWTLPDGSLSALADNTYSVLATATDAAGNSSTDSTSNELTIDGTAPTVTVNSRLTRDTTPQLTGTVSETSATVSISVGGQTRSATNNGDGTWTLPDGALSALSDGVYNVVARATDLVGNVGTDGSTNELTVDATAPEVTVNPRTTNDTRPALSGTTSDLSAAVVVRVDGQTRTATNNGNGTWSLADNAISPALAPGVYSVTVSSTDAAGNTGTDGTSNELTIDVTPPAVTVAQRITNDTTPPLNGTINDMGASISVVVGGQTRSATNNGNGTWTLANNSLSALAPGTYNVAVTATDAAGNSATDSSTNELEVDTTVPVVTINTLTTTDSTPPLSGTVNDSSATIRVAVNGQTRTATNNGSTWSLGNGSLSALPDGTYSVTVTATDPAGNVGTDGTASELTVDTTAPVITVSPRTTADTTPPLSGTVDDPAATIRVSVAGQNNLAATNNGNGTWTLSNNTLAALASGVYSVTATATDAAGNTGTDGTANELVVDATAPVVQVDALVSRDPRPALTGSVDDTTASISVNVGGQTRTATNNGNGTWTLAANAINPALGNGTYNVTVTATDAAGNDGVDATTGELTIDTVAPAITVTARTTRDTTPQLSGTVNDASATVRIVVGGQTRTATNNGNGTWTLADGALGALAAGTYNVAATATDPAGNAGVDGTSNELVVDVTAPAITVNSRTTNDNTPALSGTVNDSAATISIAVGGQTRTATNNGSTWTLANGALSALGDGTFNVVASATDLAGNVGTDGTTNELRVDTTAPEVTVSTLATNDTTPPLSGTVSESGAAISVSVAGQTRAATNNGNGTWTLADNTLSALPNGTYDVSVTATDAVNNVGTDGTTGELTIDAVAPAVAINTLYTQNARPALTGTVNSATATIRVDVGGQTDLVGVNNGNGTWTLPANTINPALAPGSYNVVARAIGGGGATGTDGSTNELHIDTTAPTVTVTAQTTADNTPGLSGTVSDNIASGTIAVSVTVNGQTRSASVSGGSWSVANGAFSAIPSGTYNVQVTATDRAGNAGTDASNNELTIDTVAPVVTVSALLTRDNRPPLSGLVDDTTATVRVTVGSQSNRLATNNGDGTWTLADNVLTTLADGLYNVQVRATDSVGNAGTDSTTDELRVDATAPTISVTARLTNDGTPDLSGTVNDTTATIQVTLSGSTYAATNNGNGTWALAGSAITPTLTSGTYSVVARATDAAGNIGTDPTTNELVVDRTAPVITVNSLPTNDATPQLSGTVDDTTATIRISVGGQNNIAAVNNGNGTWLLPAGTLTALADGVYNVVARATDRAGNVGVDASTAELDVNSQAPTIGVTALATNDTTPGLSGTIDDPAATVRISVGGQADLLATNHGDGTWTLADNTLSALSDGVYNVVATARDSQGNSATDDTPSDLTIDTTPPVAGVDALLTNDRRPALTGTTNDVTASIRIAVGGETGLVAVNNGDGTWTLQNDVITTPLADNATGYNVVATATDPVGNAGTDTTTNELRIDTSAPTVGVNSVTTSAASPQLTGTVSDNFAQISVTVGGQTRMATNNSNGTWTLASGQLSAIPSGTYAVSVTATDLAGNIGSANVSGALVVDRTAPVVTVTPRVTADTTPGLTGSVDDPAAVLSVTVNGQTFTATNNGNGTWTLADNMIAALADGAYDVVVTATDSLGNIGVEVTSNELIIDTSGPVVMIDALISNNTSPALTGTVDEPGVTVRVTVAGNVYNAVNHGDGTWSLAGGTIAPPLTPGTYDIAAVATDSLGNVAGDTSTDELLIDQTSPVVTVNTSVSTQASPYLDGTVDDIFATITVTVGGQTRTATNIGNGTWALVAGRLNPLASGVYDVAVRATDPAGNDATDTTTNELIVDVDAALVTVDELATNDSTPPLTGTVDDPAATIVVTVGAQTLTATNHGDGTWSVADNLVGPLADGAYNVLATATDAAGNISVDPTLVDDLFIITEPPVVSVLPLVTSDTTPQLNGLLNQSTSEVRVMVGGQTFDAVNNGDGTWTLADGVLAPLAEGTYDVRAEAVDLLGNVGVDGTTDELVIDSDAPAVTVDVLSSRDRTPPLTGTVSVPGIPISVTVGGQTRNAVNNGDGTWTLPDDSLAVLDDGVYDVMVIADGVVDGNDATVNELTIDTLGPSLVVGGPSVETTKSGPVSFNLHYGEGARVGLLLSDIETFSLLDSNVTVLDASQKGRVAKTFPISTATASGTVSISGTGNSVRTVTVSDIVGDGYLGIAVIGGSAVDAAGNPAASAIAIDRCYVDNTAPKLLSAGVANLGILTVTFDEAMGESALDPDNYIISGPGQGTLADNPDLVIQMSPERYRLVWSIGASVSGAEIEITAFDITDEVANLIGEDNSVSVLVEGIGVPPTVTDVSVRTARTVAVQFSEPIDSGAFDPQNYSIGGSGRGTLSVNPTSVSEESTTESRNTWLLTWDAGEMSGGGDITITVSGIADNSGDPIGSPASGTDAGGALGVAPVMESVKVLTGLSVEVRFSEAMGASVLSPANYTVSGGGRGTLSLHPDSVVKESDGRYRLHWSAGEMVNGRDVTITASNVRDAAGNLLGEPASATDAKAGRDGLIVVHIPARQDVTLYEDPEGDLANGAGASIFVGRNGAGLIRRGLLHFDVAGSIPAGSTATESVLRLVRILGAGDSVARDVGLLRVTRDWSEGGVDAGEPGADGAPAAPGEATWIHAEYDTEFWATPGGDFAAGARATTSVAGAGTHTWTSVEMLGDTQQWLDDADNNFGWLLVGDESTNGSLKRFASDEHESPLARPVLEVVYSLNGGPGGPVIGTIGDQTVEEGQTLTLALTAVDTGNNPLKFSAALPSLPAGNDAQFTDRGDGTAQFEWTPTFVDSGSYVVTFIATQSGVVNPLSHSESIVIDVTELNRAPVFEAPGTLQATEGEQLVFMPVVTDDDIDDTHTYSLAASHGDAEIDPDTGRLTWTPGFSDAGEHTISLVVTDSGSPAASDTLELLVTVTNANGPPALRPIGDQVVVERESLAFNVMATDPDLDDTLTFGLAGAPEGASIDPVTGHFVWVPNILAGGTHTITFVVTDDGTPPMEDRETVTLAVVDDNQNPTNLAVSPPHVRENAPVGMLVGVLSTVDPDAGDVHVYTLVAGEGDSGNADFVIHGNELRTTRTFNFEERSSYSVRIQTDDGKDGEFTRAVTISIVNVNDSPTSIALSNTSVVENITAGTVVGVLATADEDSANSHTYTLVSGEGDAGNALFAIAGDRLIAASALDFEAQSTHSVRVRSTDPAGASIEAVFIIGLEDENDSPDSVTLSDKRVEENQPAGTLVGTFMTTDADGFDTHRYTLVAGPGDTANADFEVEGETLVTAKSLDFERGRLRSIRVRSDDDHGAPFEMVFQIEVMDVNDPPTDIAINAAGILNDIPADTRIGALLTSDQDVGDSHVYSLVSGDGAASNALFKIVDGALFSAIRINFDSDAEFSVRIRSVDSAGAAIERALTLINDDVDGDGMSDAWELAHFGNLLAEPGDDSDGDGLTNIEEFGYTTDPTNADTDGDGVPDGTEIMLGGDPINGNVAPALLRVTPAAPNVARSGGLLILAVQNGGTAPLNWAATIVAGGFVEIVSGQSGVDAGEIELMVASNPGASAREATIRIVADGALGSPLDVVLTQAACSVPGTPTDVFASNGTHAGEVRLSWDGVAAADRYEIYRGTGADPADAQLVATVTGTAYTDASAAALGGATGGATGGGCVLLPSAEDGEYQYWVRAISVCGIGEFSAPDNGYPGPGEPPAAARFEPVMPAMETAIRTLTARADSTLAIRLRSQAGIDPASIRGIVEYAGGSSSDVGWIPIDRIGLTDGWATFVPHAGAFTPGDTVSFTVSASTVTGETIGPLSYVGTIESEETFLARIGATAAPIAQPDYADFDTRGLDLSQEDNSQVRVHALDPARAPVAPPGATGPAYAVVPDGPFAINQRVWIPVEAGVAASDVALHYYFRDKSGTASGWYPADTIAGWLVDDTILELELDGVQYVGFLVRHAGVVQLTASGTKSVESASALPFLRVGGRYGGDGIVFFGVLLIFLCAMPRVGRFFGFGGSRRRF